VVFEGEVRGVLELASLDHFNRRTRPSSIS